MPRYNIMDRQGMCKRCVHARLQPYDDGRVHLWCLRYQNFCQPVARNCVGPDYIAGGKTVEPLTKTQLSVVKLLQAGGRMYRQVGCGLDLDVPRECFFGYRVTQMTADAMERKMVVTQVQTQPTKQDKATGRVLQWGVYEYQLTEHWKEDAA